MKNIFTDNPDFYPTPESLANEMLSGLKLTDKDIILEPSAGAGCLADIIAENIRVDRWLKNDLADRKHRIDVIESDETLQATLKGKGYRVITDDFLSFDTKIKYSYVIMNPPFSSGAKHLLKALSVVRGGGKVVCLLNAETLKNQCTNERRELSRRLEELGAEIEYKDNAFSSADRKTDVEIALIRVTAPCENKSFIIEGLREKYYPKSSHTPTAEGLVDGDFIKGMVQMFNVEVEAGVTLLNEYQALKPFLKTHFDDDCGTLLIELKSGDGDPNEYVRRVRRKYWSKLFASSEFLQLLTNDLREGLINSIAEYSNYDFSEYNIRAIQCELNQSLCAGVEASIIKLFDELSAKYSWCDETSRNIHYYNGWATNKSWYINSKVILPLSGWVNYTKYQAGWEFRPAYQCEGHLSDIERALVYLDGGRTADEGYLDMSKALGAAKQRVQWKDIDTRFLTLTFYKKGTCHIVFKDKNLLKRLNIFGSQRKGFLPPSYGKKKYKDLSDREKQVVDDFQGADDYEKTLLDSEYFLTSPAGGLKMLS